MKTVVPQGTGGSNPPCSVVKNPWGFLAQGIVAVRLRYRKRSEANNRTPAIRPITVNIVSSLFLIVINSL